MPSILQGWEQAKLLERKLKGRSAATFSQRLSLNEEIKKALADWPSLQDILAEVKAKPSRPSIRTSSEIRRQEFKWLINHWTELKQYRNQWVAIEGERVVAHGVSEVEADSQARSQGIASPFVVYIPSDNEAPFIGGGAEWL